MADLINLIESVSNCDEWGMPFLPCKFATVSTIIQVPTYFSAEDCQVYVAFLIDNGNDNPDFGLFDDKVLAFGCFASSIEEVCIPDQNAMGKPNGSHAETENYQLELFTYDVDENFSDLAREHEWEVLLKSM